jgi:hypothetical protein
MREIEPVEEAKILGSWAVDQFSERADLKPTHDDSERRLCELMT